MPTLQLTDEQVVDLIEQLPRERQTRLVRNLLAQRWPQWDELTRLGEQRIRIVAAQRGRDWDTLSEEDREAFVDELVHEGRACTKS